MTSSPEMKPEIMDAAFEWLALMEDAEASESDRRAFSAWLGAAPEHRMAYERARLFWHDLGALDRQALDEAFFLPSWRERVRAALRRAALGLVPRKAAPALGGLAVAVALLIFVMAHSTGDSAQDAPRGHAFSTAIGQIRTVSLEDGSSITLGPATTVAVRFGPDSRHVEMSTGEAFFQVAKDSGRPFTVASGELLVTVHGTSFDVRRTDSSSEVAVAEGVVNVRHPSLSAAAPVRPGENKILVAGQRFASRLEGGNAKVSATPVESIGAWRRRVLVYIDAPLSEIVADMNRYQGRAIRIRGEGIGETKVTATFSTADIEGMLAALSTIFPINVEAAADSITLTRAN